jgi:hypothetical protein
VYLFICMYVCMYECMYVYIHIYIDIYIYIYIYISFLIIYKYARMDVRILKNKENNVYIWINCLGLGLCLYICMHIWIYNWLYTFLHIYKYLSTYMFRDCHMVIEKWISQKDKYNYSHKFGCIHSQINRHIFTYMHISNFLPLLWQSLDLGQKTAHKYTFICIYDYTYIYSSKCMHADMNE